MNQQFRRVFELAKQADLIQWDTLPSGAKTPDHESVAKAQKFAELLVEEMHEFIMEESANDNGIPDLGKVKEHFGVES